MSGIERLELIKTNGLAAVINAAIEAIFRFPDNDFAIIKVIATNNAPASQKNNLDENWLTPNIL